MIQSIFPTQSQAKKQYERQSYKVNSYINGIDKHITKALQSQNLQISVKKRQMLNKIQYIKDEKKKRFFKFIDMQEYFVKHCQNVLNEDIQKWKENDKFFKKLFKAYQSEIQQRKQQNKILTEKISNMRKQVKYSMKILRQNYYKSSLKQAEITDHQIKHQLASNPYEQIKSNQTIGRMATEMSLPSLSTKIRLNIPKKVASTKKLQTFIISQRAASQHNYMNPTRTTKVVHESKLGQLATMFEWYRNNINKNQQNWFEKVLFYQKNYNKLQKYLKDNSFHKIRRVATEIPLVQ